MYQIHKIKSLFVYYWGYCSGDHLSWVTPPSIFSSVKHTESAIYESAGHTQCWNFNPFQSNFSANRILPSSYLFIPAIFLKAQPREYNAQSPVHIKTHGLPRNRKSTTCAICWPKSVLHAEKRRTGSDSGAGATKSCRMSSDIGAEQENHNVGWGPT